MYEALIRVTEAEAAALTTLQHLERIRQELRGRFEQEQGREEIPYSSTKTSTKDSPGTNGPF